MRRLWVFIAVLAISFGAIADDAAKAQLDCENAAYAQYKKENNALYAKIISRSTSITVQEVIADRRMTEAYCLKHAGCAARNDDKPNLLGENFQSCLDGEAYDRMKELDELYRDTQ